MSQYCKMVVLCKSIFANREKTRGSRDFKTKFLFWKLLRSRLANFALVFVNFILFDFIGYNITTYS